MSSESEIHRGSLTGSNGDVLFLGAEACRPGFERVLTGRHAFHGEGAIAARDGVERIAHYVDVCLHPRMHVAVHEYGHLRLREDFDDGWGTGLG